MQWYAICLSDIGDYEGVKVKIGNSYIIRDHLEVRTFSSKLNYKLILMSSLFCRKPSSSIPKMPPPFIFWATGEFIYCSILVNKAENRINNILEELLPYILYTIYFIISAFLQICCKKKILHMFKIHFMESPPPQFHFEKQGGFVIFPTACQRHVRSFWAVFVSQVFCFCWAAVVPTKGGCHHFFIPTYFHLWGGEGCWYFSFPSPDSEREWPFCHI